MRVVGLGGSMQPGSRSLAAARLAVAAAADGGAQTRVFDVCELDLPPYRPGKDPTVGAEEFVEAAAGAQAMVWASPMYHGSVSGSFKNVLDWLQLLADRDPVYLTDKVVGLVGRELTAGLPPAQPRWRPAWLGCCRAGVGGSCVTRGRMSSSSPVACPTSIR